MSQQISGTLFWEIISNGKCRYGIVDVPVPPVIKFFSGSLPFQCLIRFEKVDNKLIEFLVVEAVIIDHPMFGIAERKV